MISYPEGQVAVAVPPLEPVTVAEISCRSFAVFVPPTTVLAMLTHSVPLQNCMTL